MIFFIPMFHSRIIAVQIIHVAWIWLLIYLYTVHDHYYVSRSDFVAKNKKYRPAIDFSFIKLSHGKEVGRKNGAETEKNEYDTINFYR